MVSRMLEGFRPGVKLVTYVGRRDAEKGLDLLLYAANLLRARGVEMQLVIAGPTLHGQGYVESCRLIAENLRLPVLWHGEMSERERNALFEASDVVAYPSISGEPFGMVPVEAMTLGTPVVVPDDGGVSEVIGDDGLAGGMRFKAWDTADLAERIGRLLSDGALWKRCSEAAPKVASRYTVEKMTDRILTHLGLATQPGTSQREGVGSSKG
jgi:glycosyltransferase involved in cell wall biosynthesis